MTGKEKLCGGAERYLSFSLETRQLTELREVMRVSWYGPDNSGSFRDDRTGRTATDLANWTDKEWTAPAVPGTYPLWVVLRDDRGGVTWNSLRVRVQLCSRDMNTLSLHGMAIGLTTLVLAGCHASELAVAPAAQTEAHTASAPLALNAPLETSFARWEKDGPSGDAVHRERLQKLATAVRKQLDEKREAEILFVCTHNSRRSHMAQLLGLAAARRRGLSNVRTFSGGTEVAAFNPRAVAALQRVGFEISAATQEKNPHYSVRFAPSAEPVESFSKRFTEPPNPSSGFIVVMTCSQADAACPFVEGAAARIAIPYDDPKSADDTPEETARYDERVAQIGRDLAWVFAAAGR